MGSFASLSLFQDVNKDGTPSKRRIDTIHQSRSFQYNPYVKTPKNSLEQSFLALYGDKANGEKSKSMMAVDSINKSIDFIPRVVLQDEVHHYMTEAI